MNERENLFLRHVGQTSPFPLQLDIERAKGVHFYAADGKSYIDFTSGIAVSNLGHQNKAIVKAIKKQVYKHLHTMVYGEFVEAPQVKLAKTLTDLLPACLNCVYYCTSGSETVEAAMKLAKRKTGRSEIISCLGSYHGSTHGALSIMGSDRYKQPYYPLLPDTRLIRYNEHIDLELITDKTAAVFIEVVQAASGVTPADKEWLTELAKQCKSTGAVLVFDEVQTGFGRTGSMFAFEQYGVIPDMLLLAKAMGGGVPIGALVARRELLQLFTTNPILGHINTFGGNALACAASLAMVKQLKKKPELIQNVKEKAELIKEHLRHERIEKITNAGLLMGVHFKDGEIAKQFMQNCLDEGVVLIGFLLNDKAIRLAPPLTITRKEILNACKKMNKALEKIN